MVERVLDLGLDRKTALVAGSGPGLGRSCALGLSEAGSKVVCCDLDESRAGAVAKEIIDSGGIATAIGADLRRPSDASAVVARAVAMFGTIDVVVDVIGEIRWGPVSELTDEDFDYSIDGVLRQFFNLSRAAGRQMIEQGSGGSIVSISSVSGVASAPFHAPYGAAKAGLMSLTKSLAIELAPAGIRVNSVAPGSVATPRVATRMGAVNEETAATLRSRAPLGRMGTPDEIAKVVVFCASDLASYMSGQTIVVDGAATAQFALGKMLPEQVPDNSSLEQPPPLAR